MLAPDFVLSTAPADGMTLARSGDGLTVTGISPGSDAAKAGIRAGDRIHVRSAADAYRLAYVYLPGHPFTVDVERTGQPSRPVTLRYNRGLLLAGSAGPLIVLDYFVFGVPTLLGAILVWRRLSLMTLAFQVYAVFGPYNRSDAITLAGVLPNALFGPLAFALDVLMSTTPLAVLLPFLARFAGHSKHATVLVRVADAAFVAAVLATAAATAFHLPAISAVREAQNSIGNVIALLIAACAAAALFTAKGEQRMRTGWVLAGLVVTAAAYALNTAYLTEETYWENLFFGVLSIAFPAAVAYAIMRHRVLDLGFVINRGLVYATLTALLLVVVSLVDWAVAHTLAERRLTIALDVVISVGFGLALTWLHRRVEWVIDRVLFRKRRRAQERIEVRIAALDFATSADVVDATLAGEATRILELASAAVFRIADGVDYLRTSAVGWAAEPASLARNSLLVRALLAGEGTCVVDELELGEEHFPHGHARPDLAIPIVLRHRLIAIALYGRRSDGTTLDAAERGLLERLAHAAAGAYDAAEVSRWSTLTLNAPILAT